MSDEVAPATCCHAPEGVEPAPCPHCDQELPISATIPVGGDFDADPPEWHGFSLVFGIDLFDVLTPESAGSLEVWSLLDADPPPLPFQAVYGVFLI